MSFPGEMAPKAAEALKLRAADLHRLGIIDEVVPEPLGGAHRDVDLMSERIKAHLVDQLGIQFRVGHQELGLGFQTERFADIAAAEAHFHAALAIGKEPV